MNQIDGDLVDKMEFPLLCVAVFLKHEDILHDELYLEAFRTHFNVV